MIDYVCPHCGQVLQIPPGHAGQTGKCNKCGAEITVPESIAPDPTGRGGLRLILVFVVVLISFVNLYLQAMLSRAYVPITSLVNTYLGFEKPHSGVVPRTQPLHGQGHDRIKCAFHVDSFCGELSARDPENKDYRRDLHFGTPRKNSESGGEGESSAINGCRRLKVYRRK